MSLWLACHGCQRPTLDLLPPPPNVAPSHTETKHKSLELDSSQIKPMYTELLPVDLPTVAQVAVAQNFDIEFARAAVEASLGEYESAVGGAFPAIVPTAIFEGVEGTVRATEGNLVRVGFDTFQASAAILWIVNPGRVIYDIVAAKKRLFATERQEQAVIQETLRRAVVQYYALALAQARVSAEHQGVMEAEELLRISRARVRTGTGVPADELRAEARLAARRQDLVSALNKFYNASVELAVTLHLDSAVTLLPKAGELPPTTLVRADLPIEELLGIAVVFRPDLESVRQIAQAATAETESTWWAGFGPDLVAGYQYGGITGHADRFDQGKEQTFAFSDQQRATAAAGWALSVSAFGDLKTSKAVARQAVVRAEQMLDRVRAEVVTAAQASTTQDQLLGFARQQVASAEEALRLTQANLRAGAMTTLDVLQAQDTATQARLRYAEAVVHYNQSQVNLLAALGLLNHPSLIDSIRASSASDS